MLISFLYLRLVYSKMMMKTVIPVRLGETVDIECNTTRGAHWSFKNESLPKNAISAYSNTGIFLRIRNFQEHNIGMYVCHTEEIKYMAYHDYVTLELLSKHIQFFIKN